VREQINKQQAYNLLTNTRYIVNEYRGVLYIEFATGYLILEKVALTPKDIEYGHLYSYYSINGEIYESFYTTDYKAFVKEREQLRLF
jgi:hypothetical protein